MYTRRSTYLALLLGTIWLGSAIAARAQIAFNKSVFYDTAQSSELLGVPSNIRLDFFRAKYDAAGVSLGFGTRHVTPEEFGLSNASDSRETLAISIWRVLS